MAVESSSANLHLPTGFGGLQDLRIILHFPRSLAFSSDTNKVRVSFDDDIHQLVNYPLDMHTSTQSFENCEIFLCVWLRANLRSHTHSQIGSPIDPDKMCINCDDDILFYNSRVYSPDISDQLRSLGHLRQLLCTTLRWLIFHIFRLEHLNSVYVIYDNDRGLVCL